MSVVSDQARSRKGKNHTENDAGENTSMFSFIPPTLQAWMSVGGMLKCAFQMGRADPILVLTKPSPGSKSRSRDCHSHITSSTQRIWGTREASIGA